MIGEVPNHNGNGADENAIATSLSVVARRTTENTNGENGDFAQNCKLSRKERAVLAAITDPALLQATNTEKAKAAGVSVRRFYQIITERNFAQVQRNECKSFIRSRLHRYLDAMDQAASKPNRDGFNDRRLAFEMADLYVPKQQTDHNVRGAIVGIVGVDPSSLFGGK